jgi:hypothetical protein
MRGLRAPRAAACLVALSALFVVTPVFCVPQPEDTSGLPPWLVDRGKGMATSMFGTYVREHEWLLYTFYEYTRTSHFEYAPDELGFTGDQEYSGDLREHESLVFVSHAFTDRLAFEFEAALHSDSTFHKSPDDLSNLPDPLQESGLGDVEGQLRWRWSQETEHRPELFSYFELVLPLQRDKVLIGTQDWEYSLGFAAIKGHRWGTLTGRIAAGYSESQLELGEYAVEYLKRLSPRWRFLAAVEGEQTDEVSAIVEGQVRLGRHVLLKLNSGFGLTAKAPDVAPEIGLLFSF